MARMARMPVVVGTVLAFTAYAVHVISTAVNFAFHPTLLGRARPSDFVAMAAYSLVFVGAGALVGHLTTARPAFARFASIGAVAGGVVWSYLTITWRLGWRAVPLRPPDYSWGEAWVIGAGLGALGGVLLLGLTRFRAAFAR
jgi:hypothetical protein